MASHLSKAAGRRGQHQQDAAEHRADKTDYHGVPPKDQHPVNPGAAS
jgi:hypothetical protein